MKMLEWNGAHALLPEEPQMSMAFPRYRIGERYFAFQICISKGYDYKFVLYVLITG
jgi:hypothetical protein